MMNIKFWVVTWMIVFTSSKMEWRSSVDEFGRTFLNDYETLVVKSDTTYHQKEFDKKDSAINFYNRIRFVQIKDSISEGSFYKYSQNLSQRILNIEMRCIGREEYIGDSTFITFPMGGKFYLNSLNLGNPSKNILLSK